MQPREPHTRTWLDRLRPLAALVAAFVFKAVTSTGFGLVVGRRLLAAAGWQPGAIPPTRYVIGATAAALAGSIGADSSSR